MHVLEKFNSQEHEGHEITVTLTFVYSKWICSFWMLIHFFTKFKELHSKHRQTQWPGLQLLAKKHICYPYPGHQKPERTATSYCSYITRGLHELHLGMELECRCQWGFGLYWDTSVSAMHSFRESKRDNACPRKSKNRHQLKHIISNSTLSNKLFSLSAFTMFYITAIFWPQLAIVRSRFN